MWDFIVVPLTIVWHSGSSVIKNCAGIFYTNIDAFPGYPAINGKIWFYAVLWLMENLIFPFPNLLVVSVRLGFMYFI